jgi:uncharacterized OB-fold protein
MKIATTVNTRHDAHIVQWSLWGNREGDWICRECGEERFDFEARCDECHTDNLEFDELGL